jgi:hypothetical protein
MTIAKCILLWIPMVFIGIANGVIRQAGYGRLMSELRAHQLSTLTGIILFLIYVSLVSLRWPFGSSRQAVTIGAIWIGSTAAFEFLFGRYIAGHSWSRLLQDYNILAGRLWLLVLVALAVAPYVIYRIRS